jgi:glyoxylase-like metal-dependent hydrolase (beta-lactamase superfamily II)/rhodanese-related sulfurtransferase
MHIEQFTDKALSHYSYAILCGDKVAVIDPSRNPFIYYRFAEKHQATIAAVIETHPHADFISSHCQIQKETGATIYVSKLLGAEYPHKSFDDGDVFKLNNISFTAINTPGHSPDSICIHVVDHSNDEQALFTGDTLFVGNVGRPDLREDAGKMTMSRKDLAKAMFQTMQTKFNHLEDKVLIYPAHGAGSLCGKGMSKDSSSTLGNERMGNWAFKSQTEEEFVSEILSDQPFVPSYFGFDVDTNKQGPEDIFSSIYAIPLQINVTGIEDGHLVIDTRDQADFKKGHLPNSINIMARSEGDKFETWLGTLVKPNEAFFLVIDSVDNYSTILERIAKIGYEQQALAIVTLSHKVEEKENELDLEKFKANLNDYTIIDIRNHSEVNNGLKFENAQHFPLPNLRESADKIPTDKPIVVHCAGGYRSASGQSILSNIIKDVAVYDLSFAISEF